MFGFFYFFEKTVVFELNLYFETWQVLFVAMCIEDEELLKEIGHQVPWSMLIEELGNMYRVCNLY